MIEIEGWILVLAAGVQFWIGWHFGRKALRIRHEAALEKARIDRNYHR